jgi:hypothetical protein
MTATDTADAVVRIAMSGLKACSLWSGQTLQVNAPQDFWRDALVT